MTDVLVVTGLSGAGRSVAADALEDLGWFVIDNLPAGLLPKVAELASSGGAYERVVLSMGGGGEPIPAQIESLREHVDHLTTVFLEASTEILIRRYEATRRRHPLAENRDLLAAIEHERERLAGARAVADLIIDTSELNPHQLKDRISQEFGAFGDEGNMRLTVSSFGFKHGLPADVDMVFDCRFLPNPHWDEKLRPFSGQDEQVQAYVLNRDITERFVDHVSGMLEELLPAYQAEGKSYLTVAFGCTGGRHRSVALAERMAELLAEKGWEPRISHRDIER